MRLSQYCSGHIWIISPCCQSFSTLTKLNMRWNDLLRLTFFCNECVSKSTCIQLPENHLCKYILSSCIFQLLVPRYIRVICREEVTCFTTGCLRACCLPTQWQQGIWRRTRSDHRPCRDRNRKSTQGCFYDCPGMWHCTCSVILYPCTVSVCFFLQVWGDCCSVAVCVGSL